MEQCIRKPLHSDLRLSLNNDKIQILHGSKNVFIPSSLTMVSAGRTSSRSDVFKAMYIRNGQKIPIVFKIQRRNDEKRKRGLAYEKLIYKLMSFIVDTGICPFRLRSYSMSEPENIIVTETFNNIQHIGDFIRTNLKMSKDIEKHTNRCKNLLVQLLYAIEVNYRLGIRHNDLHLNNILVRKCKPRNEKLVYLTRDKKSKYDLYLNDVDFHILIYDFDRVTKMSPQNKNIMSKFKAFWSSTPVTNLFPWQEPFLYTEKLDLFKIMQLLRESTESTYMQRLLSYLNISMSPQEQNRVARIHSRGIPLVKSNLLSYKLVTNSSRQIASGHYREPLNLPQWLKSFSNSEEAILKLIALQNQKTKQKIPIIGDMRKIYK
tara:strand:- start:2508 stop:3632 length:1125 start_codon:yes stop_codon:yes gene_type:complete